MAYKQLKLWFDVELAQLLANKLSEEGIPINHESFTNTVSKGVGKLELKDRIECIVDALESHLTGDYLTNLNCLLAILGPENKKETGMFKEFYWIMPIAKYVEKYGHDHFEQSMEAIGEITKRNTGEYAIRPFLEKYPEQTVKVLIQWSKSPNKHVRRLSSEGARPRLPWAKKLNMFVHDPSPIFPILENLKDDPSKYVQTSVANTINDILKDNPNKAKKLVESWVSQATIERKWIIKHAVRNLRKSNDQWAMEIITKL